MSLADVPDGRTILVDANILLYCVRQASGEAAAFVERCAKGSVTGLITSIVLAEFCHRRMMMEAHGVGLAASNPAQTQARKPDIVRKLALYADDVRDLLDGGLVFVPVESEDFLLSLELQHTHALLTNDSLNLAVVRRLALTDIATADRNFDGIRGITVFKPGDLR